MAAGVKCETTCAINDRLIDVIIQTADERNCDLILIASHGQCGVQRLLIRNKTDDIPTLGTVPVVVI